MQSDAIEMNSKRGTADDPIDAVFTVSNVITFARLLMAPVAVVLLLNGQDVASAIVFGVTAATDFVDGQIARRTRTVSKLGQVLDPTVDRVLMICGVVGLLAVQRLPIWIVLIVLLRDVVLFFGGLHLANNYGIRIPVIYAGKVATTLLFIGCAGLLLNMPLINGMGLVEFSWLPGFNSEPVSWGIWFVYAGLLLGIYTTCHYVSKGFAAKRNIGGVVHE